MPHRHRAALEKKLETERASQEDIFEYLRGEIHNKNNQITELQEKNNALIEDQERATLDHERQQQEMNDKLMEGRATMQREISKLKGDLDSVKTFISLKSEMETELADKTKQLKDNAAAHQTAIADLERKHVQEKDRLKKEMLYKLRETKAKLLQMTDNQLDTTTKRTIAENEQMSSELAWQSRETEKLIRRNDKLISENSALKRELGLHKQTQEDFARKVNVYQKTIKTLLAKLNMMDASQQAELQRIHLEEDEREREKAEGLREREGLEDGLVEVNSQLAAAQDEIGQLQMVLVELEDKYASLLGLQDEGVKFALQCLVDMKERTGTRADGTNESRAARVADDLDGGRSLATLDANDREEVMVYLLEQLQSYQHQLKELELHSAWKQHNAATQGNIPTNPMRGYGGVAGANRSPGPPLMLPPIGGNAATWAVAPPPQSLNAFEEGHRAPEGVTVAVNAPLRPYGKRAGPHHHGQR